MIETNIILANIHDSALDQALKTALPGKCFGLSTYGDISRPISIWLDDSATGSDQTTATNTATAHDPVFLSVDKTSIVANGTDTATITVKAPKVGAAAITLIVNGADVPVSLSSGVGTVSITSLDKTTITATVKSPANRSTDAITIQAV